MAQEMRNAIAKESEFFQKTVDSCDYGIMLSGIGGMTPTKKYLKPELHGHLNWPKWSVIWPFDENARTAFGQSENATIPSAAESWRSSFEANLPADPHDYLKAVVDYGSVLEDQRKSPARFIETIRIYLSIARYYGQLTNCPPLLAKELRDLQGRVLRLLDRVDVSQAEQGVIQDAVPVLETIAKTETDIRKRELADNLLVRFIRQARINEGLPTQGEVGDGSPPSLYGMHLEGSPIIVVRHLGDIIEFDTSQMHIEKRVNEAIGDLLRSLPDGVRFNLHWAGHVNEQEAKPLFDEPQSADATGKQRGFAWLGMKKPGHIDETRPLDV
ncbi:MAG TPA: hypothetical protein P5307_29945, partial [Pirellulaceae bacterium]|nr:hypothetical protein [Pirellulaceae bacterium]